MRPHGRGRGWRGNSGLNCAKAVAGLEYCFGFVMFVELVSFLKLVILIFLILNNFSLFYLILVLDSCLLFKGAIALQLYIWGLPPSEKGGVFSSVARATWMLRECLCAQSREALLQRLPRLPQGRWVAEADRAGQGPGLAAAPRPLGAPCAVCSVPTALQNWFLQAFPAPTPTPPPGHNAWDYST